MALEFTTYVVAGKQFLSFSNQTTSNRNRKECENDDLPLDVIDIITINTVNKIIINKNHFYQLLEESFNEKNDIDKKKKEIELLQEKIEELHAKFKKYENIDDDFSREFNKLSNIVSVKPFIFDKSFQILSVFF